MTASEDTRRDTPAETLPSIFQIIKDQGYNELESLLQKGADPNTEDSLGRTPLFHVSWRHGDWEKRVRLLLQYGADIYHRDKWGLPYLDRLLEIADDFPPNDRLMQVLQGTDINRLDDRGCNILHYVCYLGYENVFQALMKLNPDPACRTASGFLPIEIAMARKEDDEMYDDGIIEALRPISPEPRQHLPRRLGHELVQACYAGDKTRMRELLEAGAPVEGDDWGIMSPNGLADTPMLALAIAGIEGTKPTQEEWEEMTRMLVDAGADITHADDDYTTPLERAVKWNAPGMVRVLLESDSCFVQGRTDAIDMLRSAKLSGHTEIVRMLEAWLQKHDHNKNPFALQKAGVESIMPAQSLSARRNESRH